MASVATVLIADDQPIVAEALSASIGRWFRVVGTVTALDHLSAKIALTSPDVVLLDLAFGKTSAMKILPQLVDRHPKCRFVVLTGHIEPVIADEALRAGAIGYVVKHSAATELRVAIEEALCGRVYLTPLLQMRGAGGATSLSGTVTLSDRQRSILALLRAGHTYPAIARRLAISTKTVEYHVAAMTRRVGVRGKTQLIRWSEQFFADEK
ncbi:MAG TPA: response regulator transcription factor [Gemmatimonadales bacterium]